MKRQINQRDIYYCDFGDNDGSEQSGERPSLIISNDLGNVNSDTIIVLPITSKKKNSYQHETSFLHAINIPLAVP